MALRRGAFQFVPHVLRDIIVLPDDAGLFDNNPVMEWFLKRYWDLESRKALKKNTTHHNARNHFSQARMMGDWVSDLGTT